jgi:hypothetical protein
LRERGKGKEMEMEMARGRDGIREFTFPWCLDKPGNGA